MRARNVACPIIGVISSDPFVESFYNKMYPFYFVIYNLINGVTLWDWINILFPKNLMVLAPIANSRLNQLLQ